MALIKLARNQELEYRELGSPTTSDVKWKTLRLPTAASLAALGLAGWSSAYSRGDVQWDREGTVVPLSACLIGRWFLDPMA